MPGGREKPLHLQSTTDLWAGVFAIPAFGSFFLAVPLMGTPVDRSWSWWNTLGLELLFIGFFTLGGVLGGVSRLNELHRRGAWVPRGTARRPVLVSLVLVFLTLATGVAFIFVGFGVSSLAVAAGLRESWAGGLGGAVSLSLVGGAILALRRLARKPPASEDTSTRLGRTEPGDAPDRRDV
jgi:hypothetical protein